MRASLPGVDPKGAGRPSKGAETARLALRTSRLSFHAPFSLSVSSVASFARAPSLFPFRALRRSLTRPPSFRFRAFAELLIVPVCQRASVDLSGLGPAVEAEKDRLLERFCAFAESARSRLASRQIWCDLVDPCSGLLTHSPSPSPYDEVSALGLLRGFRALPLGCCRVALHPRWGARVYPATIFVKGSTHDALEALTEAGGGLERTPEREDRGDEERTGQGEAESERE